jgi:hypothetical protein
MSVRQKPSEADPWWDLEGRAAKIRRLRKRRTGDMAFVISILALILVGALWIERLMSLAG